MSRPNRSVTEDYRRGVPSALAFFDVWGRDAAALRLQAREASARRVGDGVLDAIRSVSGDRWTAAQGASLDALRAGHASVVVTGQQVGLFGGPLYSVLKAATAIRLAAELSAESGVSVVPVFWLQTEDHDLHEIDHTWVYGREMGLQRVGVDRSERRHRASPLSVSVGRRRLRASVQDALEAVESALEGRPYATEVIEGLRDAWHPNAGWGEAFASWMQGLFGDTGLLLLDPLHAGISRAWAPAVRSALGNWREVADRSVAHAAAMREQGYETQVHIRADSPLLFAHPDGVEGPRHRLQALPGDVFRLLGDGRRLTLSELQEWVDAKPECLTSSALIRPVLQDSILPTAAYVGGPGEIAYWAQLAPIYRALGVPPTPIVERWHARIVPSYTASLLRKLDVEPADVESDARVLASARLAKSEGMSVEALRDALSQSPLHQLDLQAARWVERFPGLDRARSRTRGTVERALARFVSRCEREIATADGVWRGRIERAQAVLRPCDGPQERTLAVAVFQAEVGQKRLIRDMLERARPGWDGPDDWWLGGDSTAPEPASDAEVPS